MRLNNKNKLLITGIVALGLISYKFAISKTIETYQLHQSQIKSLTDINVFSKSKNTLIQKDIQLTNYLNKFKTDNSKSFQNKLLKEITSVCTSHHLKIIDFKEPLEIKTNGLLVSYYKIQLKGSYRNLIEGINQIENTTNMGAVKNIHFLKQKDFISETDFLTAQFIIEKKETIN